MCSRTTASATPTATPLQIFQGMTVQEYYDEVTEVTVVEEREFMTEFMAEDGIRDTVPSL